MRARRRGPSASWSTVAACSTDSVMTPLIAAQALDPFRYAGVARRRYQRAKTTSRGTPVRSATAVHGETRNAATSVRAIVVVVTRTRGTPKRTTHCTRSTSFVVRPSRSPVPARSTVERGRCVTVWRNSSRSCAKMLSPSTIACRCPTPAKSVCSSTAMVSSTPTRATTSRVVPARTASTRSPSIHGTASAASAAPAWRTTTPTSASRWFRSRRRE